MVCGNMWKQQQLPISMAAIALSAYAANTFAFMAEPARAEVLSLAETSDSLQSLRSETETIVLPNFYEISQQVERSLPNITIPNPHNREEKSLLPISSVSRLDEIERPLTNAAGLLYPSASLTQPQSPSPEIQISQAARQIIDIRLERTATGFEIILETADGSPPEIITASFEQTLILQIVNAQLNLQDGSNEFRADNPFESVASVTAASVGSRTVEVRVTGTDRLLTATINSVAPGAVIGFNTGAGVAEDEEIAEIVVTATRTEEAVEDLPRSITVIDREQLDQQSSVSLTGSVGDVLGKIVPGFGPPTFTRRTGGIGTPQSLRGRPPLILIDGIAQNAANGFGFDLNAIELSAVERIEVVRGPSAAYGTGATGGIINIITRQPTEEQLENEISIGTNSALGELEEDSIGYNIKYGFSGTDGNLDMRVNASLNQLGDLYAPDGGRTTTDDSIGRNQALNFLGKIGVQLNEQQRLEASYNIYNDRLNLAFQVDPALLALPPNEQPRLARLISADFDYDEEPRHTNQVASLNYSNEDFFGSQLDLQFFYQRTDYDSRLVDGREQLRAILGVIPPGIPTIRQTRLDEQKWGFRLQARTPFSETASLLSGVDYTNQTNETNSLIIDPEALDERNEANVLEEADISPFVRFQNIGVFSQFQWDVSEQFLLNAGVRYENINFNADDWTIDAINPRNSLNPEFAGMLPTIDGGSQNVDDVVFNFGIVYKPVPEISLFANFAQGFSIPSLRSLRQVQPGFDIEDNDLLEPEKVNNYELGVRGNWQNVQFTLAGFYNHSDQGQVLTIDELGLGFLNRAPQRNYGVEATLDWQPSDSWGLGAVVSWTEGDSDLQEDGRGWLPLSTSEVQPVKATVYVQNQTLPSWQNRLQLLVVGSRDRAFDEEVDAFKVNSYATLDFLSVFQLGRGRLQLGIENLLDTEYETIVSQRGGTALRLFAPGRTVSFRYAITF